MARTLLISLVLLVADALPAVGQLPGATCEQGELTSCAVLGLVYETGAAGPRSLDRAIALYRRACDREIAAACARLDLALTAPVTLPDDPNVRIGRVADAYSGAPVSGAVIQLPQLGLRVIADEAGRVDLGRLPRGRHRIIAERLGYGRVDGDLPVPWQTEFLLFMEPALGGPVDEAPNVGRIFGSILEEGTGRGLADAEVMLLAARPLGALTNPDGRFAFTAVEPGAYEVRISRLGYETRTTTLRVEVGRTVEVHALLAQQPIELAPIEVSIGSGYLDRSGFYHRARRGGGATFTRYDLDRIDPIATSEVFRRVPGVSLSRSRTGVELVTRRQLETGGGGPCPLLAYLDGVRMTDWDVDQVPPRAVEAIEVYQGPDWPAEFGSPLDANARHHCGVVLIWTTRGG